jgi:trans-aconitate methyltransferase
MQEMKKHIWHAESYHHNSTIQYAAATEVLQYCKIAQDDKILDVGCGEGKITAEFAQRLPKGSVLGIDISPEMISFAEQKFSPNKYSNLRFLIGDCQQLNYQEDFSLIFSSFALQWIKDLNVFFKNAHKGLVKSGHLVITVPLGISDELEVAIEETIRLPEWAQYFENFTRSWWFHKPDEYERTLCANQFKPVYFNVVSQARIFESRNCFEKYVIQWLPYLQHLPTNLKHEFFNQIINKYLDFDVCLQGGSIRFQFNRIDIVACKVIP